MSVNDFFAAYRDEGLIADPNRPAVASKLPSLFIAPLGSEVPDDGILDYVTVDAAIDLLSASSDGKTTVVLVREDQKELIRVICENDHVLGINVFAMYGVPGSTYSPWFDEVTFAKERVSYSPFVSELRIISDVATLVEANRDKSTLEKEQKTYTKKSGLVKSVTASQVGVGDDSDESDYTDSEV